MWKVTILYDESKIMIKSLDDDLSYMSSDAYSRNVAVQLILNEPPTPQKLNIAVTSIGWNIGGHALECNEKMQSNE